MNHQSSRLLWLVAGLILNTTAVLMPSTALQSPARADTSAASMTTQSVDHGADPRKVLALAHRCIDPRHVALVSNALRHGRVVTLAEARGWCD